MKVLNESHEELCQRKKHDSFRDKPEFDWVSNSNSYRLRYCQYINTIINNQVYDQLITWLGMIN
jgi:hypothetical protein